MCPCYRLRTLEELLRFFQGLPDRFKLCYETSCGYGHYHDLLSPLAARVLVAHPGQLRLIFRSRNKNDCKAAARLAKLLRLGERQLTDEELARQSIPGTVLLPGEQGMPLAAAPPCLPWAGVRLYDPLYGPKPPTEECLHDGGVGRVEGLAVVKAVAETRDITICCHEAPCAPDQPLCLYKWANAQAAQVGDVVTFYLKYSNQGGQPIADVAVSDSLAGRLEYVPGSAKSDRPAVFTTQANEAGSVVLRWEIGGRLLPGTHGVVSFQARVR